MNYKNKFLCTNVKMVVNTVNLIDIKYALSRCHTKHIEDLIFVLYYPLLTVRKERDV